MGGVLLDWEDERLVVEGFVPFFMFPWVLYGVESVRGKRLAREHSFLGDCTWEGYVASVYSCRVSSFCRILPTLLLLVSWRAPLAQTCGSTMRSNLSTPQS